MSRGTPLQSVMLLITSIEKPTVAGTGRMIMIIIIAMPMLSLMALLQLSLEFNR